MQDLITQHIGMLACPACQGDLRIDGESLVCQTCGKVYPSVDGIPRLFHPHLAEDQKRDVTDIVKGFYEENPFPNYDDLDSPESLARKANRGVFARLLDEQLPQGASILEAGCGTGQLSNFLGMRWGRKVFGTDLCLNSLRLAKGFKDRGRVRQVAFLNMNLFRPAFKNESFDVVISNGVLHHTSDPYGGFQSISRLVKPGGAVIIGLYNTIGRLTTDWRRAIFNMTGNRLRFLDGHMRNKTYNEARKRAWFMDQYKHPHESKHSYSEVVDWFENNGFEFLFSIPKIDPGPFKPDEKLFEPHSKGSKLTRLMTETGMLLGGGADGALFIMIGRKAAARRAQSRVVENTRARAAAAGGRH